MSTRHISDYSKLPLDIVYDLINHDNNTSLTVEQFVLGAPEVVEDNLTSVVATAVRGSGYRGTQQFRYRRVPLKALTDLETGGQTTVIADCASYRDVLDRFNEKYGVNIGIDDVTFDGNDADASYEQPEGPVVEITITAKTDHLVWFGDTVFKLRSTVALLSDALPVTLLDGLWLPNKYDLSDDRKIIVSESYVEGVPAEIRVTEEGHIRVFSI